MVRYKAEAAVQSGILNGQNLRHAALPALTALSIFEPALIIDQLFSPFKPSNFTFPV